MKGRDNPAVDPLQSLGEALRSDVIDPGLAALLVLKVEFPTDRFLGNSATHPSPRPG